jgi:iron complex transport system substrate-binding protein
VLLIESWDADYPETQALLEQLADNPLWQELAAYQNDQIFPAVADEKDLDGMGTIGASRMLDHYLPLIYPDVFPAPLTDEEVQTILAGGNAAGASYQITDATGTTLTFDAPPERLVCLYHECIELVSALGVEPVAIIAPSWLPAFAEDPAYFAQPNDIVQLQPEDSGSWDYEAIAALQPDLVFGGDEDRTALDGITPVHSFGTGGSMSNADTLENLRALGRLLGREAEAEAAIERFQDRLAAYKELAPGDRSVLLVGTDAELAWLYAGDSVPCSILNEVAKCDWPNPDPRPGVWGYATSVEEVLQLDPDVIVLENWSEVSDDALLAQLQEDPLWSELQAFQSGRVFLMHNRDAYGLGPIGGARLLDLYVPLVYPEEIPAPLTDAEVQELSSQ